ncbi:TRAP transporter small permease [Faecalicatena sp. BF-R-105]|mgnify:FL=1|nr:TRAP transporter small permease [Faecalicatena sp. BF-R-105]
MLKRISNVFYHTLYHLSAVGFGALVALLFIQIVTRNLLKFTSSSIDEFTKFLFVWVMYLEISLAVRNERHIRVDFLIDKIKGKARRALDIVNCLLTIFFFVVLFIFGTQYGMSTVRMISPILKWSMGAMYLCIPVGCFFSILFSVEKLMKLTLNREDA